MKESNYPSIKKIFSKDTFFIFTMNFIEQCTPFCFTICHFSGNFIIPSSQNFLSFWTKKLFFWQYLWQSSREMKFYTLKEFCKNWKKWKSKGAMSGEYNGWIRTSQATFCLVIKETCIVGVFWWKIMCFLQNKSRCFLSSVAFSWSNFE